MLEIIEDILLVFAKNGLFDEGVELVGSWSFLIYQEYLGAKSLPFVTQDVDFLIPNPFRGKDHPDLLEQLERLGFRHDFRRDGSIFLWKADFLIEFLTPEKGAGSQRAVHFKKIGLRATSLRYLGFLLEDPITVLVKGIKVRVPNPANFFFHKLIISSRRRDLTKSSKDLEQAICVSTIVGAEEMISRFKILPKTWQKDIFKVLERTQKSLPLYSKEIERINLTLQNFVK